MPVSPNSLAISLELTELQYTSIYFQPSCLESASSTFPEENKEHRPTSQTQAFGTRLLIRDCNILLLSVIVVIDVKKRTTTIFYLL